MGEIKKDRLKIQKKRTSVKTEAREHNRCLILGWTTKRFRAVLTKVFRTVCLSSFPLLQNKVFKIIIYWNCTRTTMNFHSKVLVTPKVVSRLMFLFTWMNHTLSAFFTSIHSNVIVCLLRYGTHTFFRRRFFLKIVRKLPIKMLSVSNLHPFSFPTHLHT